MKDQGTIRKAVELADGFEYRLEHYWACGGQSFALDEQPSWFLDALAAQLVRQVDAIENLQVESQKDSVAVSTADEGVVTCRKNFYDKDRTMNTIKAIVDSGVLPAPDTQAKTDE